MRIHVCRDLVYLDSLGPPSVASQPLGSRPGCRTPRAICICVCVCVCAYTHVLPRTLPPPSRKKKHRQNFIFPHLKNKVPRQQQVPCSRTPQPSSPNANEQIAHMWVPVHRGTFWGNGRGLDSLKLGRFVDDVIDVITYTNAYMLRFSPSGFFET